MAANPLHERGILLSPRRPGPNAAPVAPAPEPAPALRLVPPCPAPRCPTPPKPPAASVKLQKTALRPATAIGRTSLHPNRGPVATSATSSSPTPSRRLQLCLQRTAAGGQRQDPRLEIRHVEPGRSKAAKITVKADAEGELVNCATVTAIPRLRLDPRGQSRNSPSPRAARPPHRSTATSPTTSSSATRATSPPRTSSRPTPSRKA